MKNILLIEDEDNLNRGISLKLQKEGYTVFSAATVAEGLSLFQANTIDLVICDIGLPDGNGLDLCASIRKKSDVLFLFLTALDTEVDMITGYEMGADDYVTKPFSMSVLISKISAMLKRTEKTISNVVQTGELTFYILNVPLEEFEEFKSHSLSVRTPSGRKMDLKQAPVRGLGTPNGGIVVFDKTSGEAMNIMPKSSAHVTLRCQDE